jgi:hypothetical protein
VLKKLQDGGLVRHASGHPDHPVIYGSFIYFLRLQDKETESPYRGDFEAFQVKYPLPKSSWCRYKYKNVYLEAC